MPIFVRVIVNCIKSSYLLDSLRVVGSTLGRMARNGREFRPRPLTVLFRPVKVSRILPALAGLNSLTERPAIAVQTPGVLLTDWARSRRLCSVGCVCEVFGNYVSRVCHGKSPYKGDAAPVSRETQHGAATGEGPDSFNASGVNLLRNLCVPRLAPVLPGDAAC